MSKVKFSDNAATVLNAPVEVGHTVMIVANASQFPILTSGSWLYITVEDEVVKTTNTSGNVFTCEPFQQSHGVGASVEIRTTAGLLSDLRNADVYESLGVRPANGTIGIGEPFINLKDKQFGVGNELKNPIDLIGVRFHSSEASYIINDMVVYNGNIYKALSSHSGTWSSSSWELIYGSGQVESVVGTGSEIDVDSSDPQNPTISISSNFKRPLTHPGGFLAPRYHYGADNTITIDPCSYYDETETVVLTLPAEQSLVIPSTVSTLQNLFLCDDGVVYTDVDEDGATLLAGTITHVKWIGCCYMNLNGDLCEFIVDPTGRYVATDQWYDFVQGLIPISYTQYSLVGLVPLDRVGDIKIRSSMVVENPQVHVSADGSTELFYTTREDIPFREGWFLKALGVSQNNGFIDISSFQLLR